MNNLNSKFKIQKVSELEDQSVGIQSEGQREKRLQKMSRVSVICSTVLCSKVGIQSPGQPPSSISAAHSDLACGAFQQRLDLASSWKDLMGKVTQQTLIRQCPEAPHVLHTPPQILVTLQEKYKNDNEPKAKIVNREGSQQKICSSE